jgi:hypothetical protein
VAILRSATALVCNDFGLCMVVPIQLLNKGLITHNRFVAELVAEEISPHSSDFRHL